MSVVFDELNKDQLSGLANLCFDLAKAAFIFVFIPAITPTPDISVLIFSKIAITFIGIAFTRGALILLKLKEEAKK